MKYDIPFVGNTEDDLHCLQAAYMMIARYFQPDFAIGMDEWSELTGYVQDKGTWATKGLLWFNSHDYEVRHITLFDYDDFAATGDDYLMRLNGPEVGQWQIEHSDVPSEIARSLQLIEAGVWEKREPTQADIKRFLNNGWLVRIMVNMSTLNHKTGYIGHAVVVSGYDETGFIIQDPGAPPEPNRHVLYADFEAAWADPNPASKELDAIRLTK